MVRSALDEAYGAGKVSLVSAAFRWLQHHSQMKTECNGEGDSLSAIQVDCNTLKWENGENLRPLMVSSMQEVGVLLLTTH